MRGMRVYFNNVALTAALAALALIFVAGTALAQGT